MGDAQRQTLYTLFLAFVPFAAIVSILALNRNIDLIAKIENLSRQLAEAESLIDLIGYIFGDESSDIETLQEKISYAVAMKVTFEKTSADHILANGGTEKGENKQLYHWIFEDSEAPTAFQEKIERRELGTSLSDRENKAIEEANLLAKLTTDQRIEALTNFIVEEVAIHTEQKEGKTIELRTRNHIAKRLRWEWTDEVEEGEEKPRLILPNAHPVKTRIDTAFHNMLVGVGRTSGINQTHVEMDGREFAINEQATTEIRSHLNDYAKDFIEPPKSKEQIITHFVKLHKDDALAVLSDQAEEIKKDIRGTVFENDIDLQDFEKPDPNSTPQLVPAEIIPFIKGTLDEKEIGLMTQPSIEKKAGEIYAAKYTSANELLSEAMDEINFNESDERQLRDVIRNPNEEDVIILVDSLLKHKLGLIWSTIDTNFKLNTDNARAIAGFPGIVQVLNAKRIEYIKLINDKVAREIDSYIIQAVASSDQMNGILEDLTEIRRQIGNQEFRSSITPDHKLAWSEMLAQDITKKVNQPLLSKERTKLAEDVFKALAQIVDDEMAASLALIKDEGETVTFDEHIDLNSFLNRDALIVEFTNRIFSKLQNPEAFDSIQKEAAVKATLQVDNLLELLAQDLRDYVNEELAAHAKGVIQTSIEYEDPQVRNQMALSILEGIFPISSPPLGKNHLKGSIEAVPESILEIFKVQAAQEITIAAIEKLLREGRISAETMNIKAFAGETETDVATRLKILLGETLGVANNSSIWNQPTLNEAINSEASDFHGIATAKARNLQLDKVKSLDKDDLPINVRKDVFGQTFAQQISEEHIKSLVKDQLQIDQLADETFDAITSRVSVLIESIKQEIISKENAFIESFAIVDLSEDIRNDIFSFSDSITVIESDFQEDLLKELSQDTLSPSAIRSIHKRATELSGQIMEMRQAEQSDIIASLTEEILPPSIVGLDNAEERREVNSFLAKEFFNGFTLSQESEKSLYNKLTDIFDQRRQIAGLRQVETIDDEIERFEVSFETNDLFELNKLIMHIRSRILKNAEIREEKLLPVASETLDRKLAPIASNAIASELDRQKSELKQNSEIINIVLNSEVIELGKDGILTNNVDKVLKLSSLTRKNIHPAAIDYLRAILQPKIDLAFKAWEERISKIERLLVALANNPSGGPGLASASNEGNPDSNIQQLSTQEIDDRLAWYDDFDKIEEIIEEFPWRPKDFNLSSVDHFYDAPFESRKDIPREVLSQLRKILIERKIVDSDKDYREKFQESAEAKLKLEYKTIGNRTFNLSESLLKSKTAESLLSEFQSSFLTGKVDYTDWLKRRSSASSSMYITKSDILEDKATPIATKFSQLVIEGEYAR